jgi:hypothetical protein
LNPSGKFCPICKNKNPHTATVCRFCGAVFDENLTNLVATTKNTGGLPALPAENLGSFVNAALIPEGGIGIYAAGALVPYYLNMDKELVIGRKTETTSESVLDLTDLDAFNMGISRRHAIIRRTESGFEIMDLSSTNGTWLNNERLTPNKPYPFASGSQLRVGRLRLFILYHHAFEGTKKK